MIPVAASWVLTLAVIAFALRAQRRLVLVARAAHELRGPLFAAQLGLHGLGGEPARVAAIELELQRAGRALDDLTAAPSGARGESREEPVDVGALVDAYAGAWGTLAAAYGAELHVDRPDDVTVLADPLRLAQACANLVGNAAEHGRGPVRVRVRAAGGRARIEVADEGPGLAASVAALTATAGARRGRRGHGLAIAAAIAEHHGGRLTSCPSDSGARLVLDFPAAQRELTP
jgi:signal transduction histidine kinase